MLKNSKVLKIRRIISGISKLSWQEMLLACQISLLVILLPVLQKALPLPTLLKRLTPNSRKRNSLGTGDTQNMDMILKLTQRILWLHFWVFHPTCLKRSLVLYHFLRRYGYPVCICFGVAKSDAELTGHSWISLHGRPVSEYDDQYLDYDIAY